MFQCMGRICFCPVVWLQLTQSDKLQRIIICGNCHLHILSPKPQAFLAYPTRGQDFIRSVFIIPDQTHTMRNPFVVFVRLQHCTRLDTQNSRRICCVNADTGKIMSVRRMHDSRPAPAGRISLFNQCHGLMVHLFFNVKVSHVVPPVNS